MSASTGNTDALFPATVLLGQGKLTVANTNLDGVTGTLVTLATGTQDGIIIENLILAPMGTVIQTVARFFIVSGGVGTFLCDKLIPAYTLITTAELPVYRLKFDGTDANYPRVLLPLNATLVGCVNIGVAAGISVMAIGGKY